MPKSAPQVSRALRVPFNRVYNALSVLGKTSVQNDQVLRQLIVELQQAAVPFTSLANELGSEMTLGELAEMEQTLVREKYRELWDKRSQISEKKDKFVDFTGEKEE